MDLDFLLTRMKAGQKELDQVFEEIVSIPSNDGFIFTLASIELLSQPHMEYPGYRATLSTSFGRMRDKIQVDVGVGDVVEPLTREISLVQYRGNPLFESSVSLQVYPIETIFAEKLETILSKGSGNSRMKDYHDLFFLLHNTEKLDLDKLKETVVNTFSHRGTTLRPIEFDNASCMALQTLWAAHCHSLSNVKGFSLPLDITTVIEEINQFLARAIGVSKVELSKR